MTTIIKKTASKHLCERLEYLKKKLKEKFPLLKAVVGDYDDYDDSFEVILNNDKYFKITLYDEPEDIHDECYLMYKDKETKRPKLYSDSIDYIIETLEDIQKMENYFLGRVPKEDIINYVTETGLDAEIGNLDQLYSTQGLAQFIYNFIRRNKTQSVQFSVDDFKKEICDIIDSNYYLIRRW